jgi:hypothetical protein
MAYILELCYLTAYTLRQADWLAFELFPFNAGRGFCRANMADSAEPLRV